MRILYIFLDVRTNIFPVIWHLLLFLMIFFTDTLNVLNMQPALSICMARTLQTPGVWSCTVISCFTSHRACAHYLCLCALAANYFSYFFSADVKDVVPCFEIRIFSRSWTSDGMKLYIQIFVTWCVGGNWLCRICALIVTVWLTSHYMWFNGNWWSVQRERDCIYCWECTLSVVGERNMSIEDWWKDNDGEKTEIQDGSVSQCHVFHHICWQYVPF